MWRGSTSSQNEFLVRMKFHRLFYRKSNNLPFSQFFKPISSHSFLIIFSLNITLQTTKLIVATNNKITL